MLVEVHFLFSSAFSFLLKQITKMVSSWKKLKRSGNYRRKLQNHRERLIRNAMIPNHSLRPSTSLRLKNIPDEMKGLLLFTHSSYKRYTFTSKVSPFCFLTLKMAKMISYICDVILKCNETIKAGTFITTFILNKKYYGFICF